jgi:hypothetical protein
MKKTLLVSLTLVSAFVLSVAQAATITEDFSTNPLQNRWQIFGDTNLFRWDSTNQNLNVTWDSSQTNSYFYHSLGTILAKDDDFSVAFDLQLNGVEVDGWGFELAIGFLNFASATSTNLERGTGVNSEFGPRNLVEFDYFPDAGYGATISPMMISSNNQFVTGFDFPLELTNGDWFHVVMNYTASNQTLSTVMTCNGQPFGPIQDIQLDESFTDFRLDAVAVSGYSDVDSGGSILAHGVVDNLVVIVPPPPVQNLTDMFSNGIWQAQFTGRSNWIYALERTTDFQSWTDIVPLTAGNATNLFLQDTNPPADKAFYRVSAERP